MIVFGEAHLRRILGAYAAYYNESRTHRSLNKDAPFHRAIERLGAITPNSRWTSPPILQNLIFGTRTMRPNVPIIMITAYGDAETMRKALENVEPG